MMIRSLVVLFLSSVISVSAAASVRGNLNVNYQQSESEAAPKTWSAAQIMNIYMANRIFHDNDYLLGAYILRTSNSTRKTPNVRIRYSLNMTGYRYSLYTTYSPFKIFRPGLPDQYNRIFQATLNYQPKMLPDISLTYAISRIFTRDNPRTENARNTTWTINSQFSKSFGTFRGTYWRQQSKPDINRPERQLRTAKNFSYNIGKRLPGAIAAAASYTLTDNENEVVGRANSSTLSHTVAASAGRQFGKWFNVMSAFSGRQVDFDRFSGESEKINDYGVNLAGTVNPREDVSVTLLRSYSSNQTVNDSTVELVNDYFNFGANYRFPFVGGREASLAFSRSIYYQSSLGKSVVDNGSFIGVLNLYRQTEATVNISVSHNNKAAAGKGRFQMTRIFNIVAQPLPQTTVTVTHQASGTSEHFNLVDTNNENLSIIFSQILKRNFNYTVTYSRSVSKLNIKNVVSSISTAANYRVTRAISVLITYSRTDLGRTVSELSGSSTESLSGRIGWILTRKSSLTLNYTISNINAPSQTQNIGGYFVTSF